MLASQDDDNETTDDIKIKAEKMDTSDVIQSKSFIISFI